MGNLYVIGVAQFLYGVSIANKDIERAYLVKVSGFVPKGGERSFRATVELMKEMCSILDIDFNVLHISDLRQNINQSHSDYVDITIIARLGSANFFNNPTVLALQVEHINLVRPAPIRFYTPSFRKRFDLWYHLIKGRQIKDFYTLSPISNNSIFYKENVIPRERVRNIGITICEVLRRKNQYKFLSVLKEIEKHPKIVILPLANHFGGSENFNRKLIEWAIDYGRGLGIYYFIVKNHPSDPFDYSKLVPTSKISHNIQLICYSEEIHRTFPLELLVELMGPHMFIGAESTAFFIFHPNQMQSPVAIEERNRRSYRARKYDIGERLELCEAREVYI